MTELSKPSPIRVHGFVDAQNLFYAVRECFGFSYPNFDPKKLVGEITALEPDRVLEKVHFYTGLHDKKESPFWHGFWSNKILALERAGIRVVHRPLKYSEIQIPLEAGKFKTIRRGREKGIDVRLALDLVRLARRGEYDLAIIFSQDTDLAEAVEEVYELRKELHRWIKIESAFPLHHERRSFGINKTKWRPIPKEMYERCTDPRDYRPKGISPTPPP